eukprot:943340-Prorocentrum_minimum.AAC.1
MAGDPCPVLPGIRTHLREAKAAGEEGEEGVRLRPLPGVDLLELGDGVVYLGRHERVRGGREEGGQRRLQRLARLPARGGQEGIYRSSLDA